MALIKMTATGEMMIKMERAYIKETGLSFCGIALVDRLATDLIVIHHTGNENGVDTDPSAADIHQWHQNIGYSGIGYHYVIRKDGTIERGRAEWAQGAHAYGENWHSIGIHLSGTFTGNNHPTDAQIESVSMLIANICADYGIKINRKNIVGHGELMATDCPGENLLARLDEIVGKANWYRDR